MKSSDISNALKIVEDYQTVRRLENAIIAGARASIYANGSTMVTIPQHKALSVLSVEIEAIVAKAEAIGLELVE